MIKANWREVQISKERGGLVHRIHERRRFTYSNTMALCIHKLRGSSWMPLRVKERWSKNKLTGGENVMKFSYKQKKKKAVYQEQFTRMGGGLLNFGGGFSDTDTRVGT